MVLHESKAGWFGPVAATMAGWAFAANVAMAGSPVMTSTPWMSGKFTRRVVTWISTNGLLVLWLGGS